MELLGVGGALGRGMLGIGLWDNGYLDVVGICDTKEESGTNSGQIEIPAKR